jgi:hypothetical protein
MTRLLRFSLFALFIVAMSTPAFAWCKSCNWDFTCEHTPDSGTWCVEHFDYCEEWSSNCIGVADHDTLAGTLAIASVEVVTPAGVRTTDTPRLTARQPVAQSAASTFTR